jgi:3-hydroxyisobutyrate dehydrogenase-like beta-hydroxyacid dehydrogenase
MMADPAALLAVAVDEDGLATAPNAHGKLLIDMSTVGPDSSGRVAAAAESNGLSYLRAPVSGNPGVVRAGNLTIVVSGARDAFDSAADLLRDIGPTLFYVGEGERSRVVKLALNLMIGGTSQLLAEAVTLGESYGVDRSDLLEVVAASAIGSPFVRYKKDALANDDYSTTFTTTGLRKDMDLALDCASESGVPLPVTAMVQQLLQACISSGMGNLDFTALLPRLQREAGAIDELPGIGAAAAPH